MPVDEFENNEEDIKQNENELVKKEKFDFNPGDYKYPFNKNFVNESKTNFQFDSELKSAYEKYEYMLGELWYKEKYDLKNIIKDFTLCPTNQDLFIDVKSF